ncbi:MAG: DUF6065 family protein [Betaproteobacteria bacterium]
MISFYKVYPDARDPFAADSAALGRMPLSAFRYCEAMRRAASWGWYIFPPIDIALRFDGINVEIFHDRHWIALREAYLPGLFEHWNAHCPPQLRGLAPPYIRPLPTERGVVQIWSGYLVRTAPGWSCNIRSLSNVIQSNDYRHYEGIVETDAFGPSPLFTNMQLLSTNTTIQFLSTEPLFQVQAMQRSSYSPGSQAARILPAFQPQSDDAPSLTEADWDGYRKTVRAFVETETHRVGEYGAACRKRSKQGPGE